jgi:peptidase inhibitor family I36
MKRKVTSLLLATLAGVVVFFAAPAPVQASLSSCTFNFVCLWDGDNYETGTFLGQWQSGRGTCVNLPSLVNDKANSFYNHMDPEPVTGVGRHMQLYRDINCTGYALRVNVRCSSGCTWWAGPYPASYHNNLLTVLGTSDDNRASSIWFNSG